MHHRKRIRIAAALALAAVLMAMAPLQAGAVNLSVMAKTVTVTGFSFTSCADAEAMALQAIRQNYIIVSWSSDRRGDACEVESDELLGDVYYVTVTAKVVPKLFGGLH